MTDNRQKAVYVFMAVVSLTGLALGISDSIFANYFRDAFNVYALQRGIIELPRESPGVIVMFIVSALAFVGDMKLALAAQLLSIFGLLAMGLLNPSFTLMLIFLFIYSLGFHMFLPLYDSIGMSLAKEGEVGKAMGRFNSLRTGFSMIAGIWVFVGFRSGFFSFTTPIILNFVIAGGLLIVVFMLLLYMRRLVKENKTAKSRFVLKKEYKLFYMLACLVGAKRQIMYVYGPWVLIELLGFGADVMSLLIIAGAGFGMLIIPIVGRWIDKYGTARILVAEGIILLVIYSGYGIISAGLHEGWLIGIGSVAVLAAAISVTDRMTMQFAMVRSVYMRSIALEPEDVTPTLATGMAVDHVLSIAGAIICGYLWWEWGPQYVFVFAGVLAVLNIVIAQKIQKASE